jgi:hypothetical protein
MSKNAGQLLWNRVNLFIGPGATVDVDTGLCQVLKAWGASSINEPGFGFPSRIQVIPMAPVGGWLGVSHGEPFLDPATDTIHVSFTNNGEGPAFINVLFWNPHTLIGPGEADGYNPLT